VRKGISTMHGHENQQKQEHPTWHKYIKGAFGHHVQTERKEVKRNEEL